MAQAIFEGRVGDIGTSFRVAVVDALTGDALDISAATTKELLFKKPGGDLVTQTADFVTTGTDGLIEYLSVEDDLDEPGTWYLMAYLDLGDWIGHSEPGKFVIRPVLAADD